MLDETHPGLPNPPADPNIYCIGEHNIVIACLPKEEIDNNTATTVASRMLSTFPAIRFGLLVGIGGGVPSKENDIRLGDVVVSTPTGQHGGVIKWDMENTTEGGHFQRTGTLNSPPTVLRTALAKLESTHQMQGSKVLDYISSMVANYPRMSKFTHPDIDDVLFEADYEHMVTSETCSPVILLELCIDHHATALPYTMVLSH